MTQSFLSIGLQKHLSNFMQITLPVSALLVLLQPSSLLSLANLSFYHPVWAANGYWLQELEKKIDMAFYCMIFGYLSNWDRMLRSLYAGNTCSSGYCLLCVPKKLLFEQAACYSKFSTLELPVSKIYSEPFILVCFCLIIFSIQCLYSYFVV